MITAGDFRNGVTFEMDGQVMQVVEFQHVKPGKGAAFVRTKMKNVITGTCDRRRVFSSVSSCTLCRSVTLRSAIFFSCST